MKVIRFVILATLLNCCFCSVGVADSLRTVVLTGNPAPGTGSGETFHSVYGPVLNNSGQVAIQCQLADDVKNKHGIWSEGDGLGLALVVRESDPAPGTDAHFDYLFSQFLSNSGHTAFMATLYADLGTGGDRGIWSEGSGNGLGLVARKGNSAPGTESGVNFDRFDSLVLNGSGQSAFSGLLIGTGIDRSNDRGVWSEGGDSGLTLVARTGDAAPGGGDGAIFSNIFSPVTLNDSGHTAFYGYLTGIDIDYSNGSGIWAEREESGLTLVARAGDAAPGTASGVKFGSFKGTEPTLNNKSQIAFCGYLTGTDVDLTNNNGIWSEGEGNGLALVVRAGDPEPNIGMDVTFRGFNSDIALNSNGITAFRGSLTGTGVDSSNDRGIWSVDNGRYSLVARTGSEAPGTESGVAFSSINRFVLNSNSQIAFWSYLTGTGVDSTNHKGIWAENLAGDLQLIARTGDLLDVDDGPGIDLRTISSLSFVAGNGNEDGRQSGFNELGQLAFSATFTDGTSGAFVSNLVAVPEPSTLLLSTLATLLLLAGKRR